MSLRLPLFDYDLWWHLASGRTMVETQSLLKTEIFSHTLQGSPWINFEWLSQILLYLTVQFTGLTGLAYGKVIFCFLLIGLFSLLLKRLGARGPALLLLTLIGFLALKSRLYERVELASLFLLLGEILLITEARRHPTSKLVQKTPWILMVMMVLWCNLHGGFIYGVATLFLLNAGARWAKEPKAFISILDKSFCLVLVGLLINPYGPKLVEIFLEHAAQMSGAPLFIEEWLPTSVDKAPIFWVLFILSATALVTGLLKNRPQVKFWAPLILVFAIWGTRHMRNAILFPLFALPFLVDLSVNWEELMGWFSKKSTRAAGWLLATTAVIATIFSVNPVRADVIQTNRFPIGACEFLKTNNIVGRPYNTYHLGGYIEWAMGPGYPVFMDGRYLFHPLLVMHNELDNGLVEKADGSDWQKFLGSYGVDHAIVDYSSFLIDSQGKQPFPLTWANLVFPKTEWALVYWDDAAMVFLKRSPAFEKTIKQFEYASVWPYNPDEMKYLIESHKVTTEQVEKDLLRHRLEVPFCITRNMIEKTLGKKTDHVE